MRRSKRLLAAAIGFLMFLSACLSGSMTAQAGEKKDCLEDLRGGVAAVLSPGDSDSVEMMGNGARAIGFAEILEKEQERKLVMANVKSALNVRSDASETAEKVGMLYKDCGGYILERRDGWTKLQSGNIIGWASDEFLLFDDEALELANSVGKMVATIDTDALRIRREPSTEAGVWGMLPKGDIVEVLSQEEDGWICVDYEGSDGYVSAEYVALDFIIDSGETVEEIKARQKAEEEAKRHVNYGEYTTDADTTLLLAALIQCEAGGESYEGQVAVGAVVMNRVRSGAYPNTIHGVIYASGQFTPAMTGKLNRVYESGNIYASCIKAAEEALSGVSNVGDLTHFRRNNGREGLVIGNHVFY